MHLNYPHVFFVIPSLFSKKSGGREQTAICLLQTCMLYWLGQLLAPNDPRNKPSLPVNANRLLAEEIHASMDMMARQQSGRFMQAPWGLNKVLLDGGLAWYAYLKLEPQRSVP